MYRFWLISILFLVSCGNDEEVDTNPQQFVDFTPEQSSEMNQDWLKDEQFLIDQFVEQQGWDMIETESGLRYMIYKHGDPSGMLAEPRQVAWVQFEIAPLADTVVYRSDPEQAQSFLIEMDHVENGLHEAITYMRVGDQAKIILPHHLAHGLLGDNIKIPPLTAVVYDLKLVGLE